MLRENCTFIHIHTYSFVRQFVHVQIKSSVNEPKSKSLAMYTIDGTEIYLSSKQMAEKFAINIIHLWCSLSAWKVTFPKLIYINSIYCVSHIATVILLFVWWMHKLQALALSISTSQFARNVWNDLRTHWEIGPNEISTI